VKGIPLKFSREKYHNFTIKPKKALNIFTIHTLYINTRKIITEYQQNKKQRPLSKYLIPKKVK